MKKEDYVLATNATEIIIKYKNILLKINKIDLTVQKKKNALNVTIGKIDDPLGDDYKTLMDYFEILNNEITDLMARRNEHQQKLLDIRKEEKDIMKVINNQESKGEIMQKITSDNVISLEINK